MVDFQVNRCSYQMRYELTLQNAQRVLASLLEQPAKPWVPFKVQFSDFATVARHLLQVLDRGGRNLMQ